MKQLCSIDSVKNLRATVANNVTIRPGVYRWWFKADALHHIVKPETPLGYYDYSLVGAQNSTKKVWAERVVQQLQDENVDLSNDEIIILAGKDYYKFLTAYMGNYILPYREAGCRGIGEILKFLNTNINK